MEQPSVRGSGIPGRSERDQDRDSRPVALVTGATTGIGAEFARALAARSYDIVLAARTEERLRSVAAELERSHGVSTEVLPVDLTTDAGVGAVEQRLQARDRSVDLLVNNAGFGTVGKFHQLPVDRELAEIQLNVVTLVRLAHAALVAMVERGAGGVINVSSTASYQPMPGSATYAATKAFVSSFTNALHEEVKGTGVKVMVLAPGFTHTEFHDRVSAEEQPSVRGPGIPGRSERNRGVDLKAMPELLWQSPGEVVSAALRDFDRGLAVSIPSALNKAVAAFSSVLPAGVTRRLVREGLKRAR